MNKRDFLEIIKETGSFNSKVEAEEALDAIVNSIKKVLKQEDKITLSGLGTFYTADVKRRTGVVPKTGKTYVKEAHKTPRFRVSKTLKDMIEKN